MEDDVKGLIIYSGGMDSTVLLHDKAQFIKMAVSFDYGSKHNNQEFAYALMNTRKLKIPHLRIPLTFIPEFFKSDLIKGQGEIPEGHYENPSMKRTVVPFRNGIMLSIAVGLAESNGLNTVFIANHAGDHAIYPDCRASFLSAFNQAAKLGTYEGVDVFGPYTTMTKRQIAEKGKEIGVHFLETYSCYKGGPIHCGKCGTCVERKEALAGFDPTPYLDVDE